jgi:tetratricopeptide (TPR) repeat protein
VLDRAINLAPDDVDLLFAQSAILADIAAYEAALVPLERALEIEPRNADCMRHKPWTLQHLWLQIDQLDDRFMEAHELYEAAAERDPDDVWTKRQIAEGLVFLGRPQEARELFQRIIDEEMNRDAGGDKDSLARVAACYAYLGKYDEAMRIYAQIVSEFQDTVDIRFELALTALWGGRRLALGKAEYLDAINEAARKDSLRRRGVLDVARYDLAMTLRQMPEGSRGVAEMREVDVQLLVAYEDAKRETAVADHGAV